MDLEKIDFERFRKKAERLGRDPDSVTPERIMESFNPVHTWTEFVNRVVSLPVGFFSLGAVVVGFGLPRKNRALLLGLAVVGLLIVLVNAVMGAMVVYSGLKPGIITLHLALAMGLLGLLVFCRWKVAGSERHEGGRVLFRVVCGLLGLVFIEGVMGAQVRELTDELAKSHRGEERAEWIGELEESAVYLAHRSFSWLIVLGMGVAFWMAKKRGVVTPAVLVLAGLVLAMMVMGVVLAHVGVFPWVQVLHVGLAAIMLVLLCDWALKLWPARA